MNKKILLFVGLISMAFTGAVDAVTIKKAASVETKKTDVKAMTGGVAPTVMGVINTVKQIKDKQATLTAECKPSSQDIENVNKILKEWAKAGRASADEVQQKLGMRRCSSPSGGYEVSVQLAAGEEDGMPICYDYFNEENAVWHLFPVATMAYYCTDGSVSGCSDKNRKDVTNMYDILNLVDFADVDMTADEIKVVKDLRAKADKCSDSKINAESRALWADLVVSTIGGVGQSTDTGNIMQAVSGATNSGIAGILSTFGTMATQVMGQ